MSFRNKPNKSISNYNEIDVDNTISFKNFWGSDNIYNVEKIIHIKNLNNINKYTSNFTLIIKDYYKMEYIIYLCN